MHFITLAAMLGAGLVLGGCGQFRQPVPYVSSWYTGPHGEDWPQDSTAPNSWVRPPGAVGDAVTPADLDLRWRLDQALEKTPTGGTDRWAYHGDIYTFQANTPMYAVQASGQWCRDGWLIRQLQNEAGYDSQMAPTRRLRGLFCKTQGSDWLLQR